MFTFDEQAAQREGYASNWEYDDPEHDGAAYLQQELVNEVDEVMVAKASAKPLDGYLLGDDFEGGPQAFIRRRDQERATRVAKRRMHTNLFMRAINTVVPYGGLASSAFSLASSSIGAGIIALPSAFQTSGLGMAIIYLVVVALLTTYSHTLLATTGKKTGLRNYEQIVAVVMGKGAAYLLAFCLWFLSFGGEVSYVISVGDIVSAFISDVSNPPVFLASQTGRRVITFLIWLVCMLPLTLPREINSLRYFSCIAIFLIVFFVFSMIVHAAQNGLKHGVRNDLVYFQSGNNAVQGLSIFMFAFINQLNSCEVFEELHKPTIKRATLGAGLGVLICFVLYFLAGVIGYLDFGPAVTGSALKLYHPGKELLMGISYVVIMLKLCVGYGLHMIPVREAIYHVVKADVKTVIWWKHALVVTSMALLSLIAGLFLPRINLVFGLVGGSAGGFIAYVFPALMFMYTGNWSLQSVGCFHYFATHLLLIAGVIGIVFGTSAAIYGEVTAS